MGISFDEHWKLVKQTEREVEVRGKWYTIPEDFPLSYGILSAQAAEIVDGPDATEEEIAANNAERLRLGMEMQNEAMNYFFGPEVIAEWSREGMGQREFYSLFGFVSGLYEAALDKEVEGDPKAGEAS